MIKKSLMIFLVGIFLLQFALAVDTTVTIYTLSNHDLFIQFLNPGVAFPAIKSINEKSGLKGETSVVFSSDVDEFELAIWVKKNNDVIVYEKFDQVFSVGESISLDLYPEWYLIENDVENTITLGNEVIQLNSTNTTTEGNETSTTNITLNTTNLTDTTLNTIDLTEANETNLTGEENNASKTKKGISGFFTFEKKGVFSLKTIFYTLGVILILIALFYVFKFIQSNRFRKIRVTKLSDMTSGEKSEENDSEGDSNINKIIKDAERKIKKAQEELDGLKKESKIKEIKKKLEQDKKELRELSRG